MCQIYPSLFWEIFLVSGPCDRISKARDHQALQFFVEQIDVWIQLSVMKMSQTVLIAGNQPCVWMSVTLKRQHGGWNWCTSLKASIFLAWKETSVSLDELCKQDSRFFGLSSSVGAGTPSGTLIVAGKGCSSWELWVPRGLRVLTGTKLQRSGEERNGLLTRGCSCAQEAPSRVTNIPWKVL